MSKVTPEEAPKLIESEQKRLEELQKRDFEKQHEVELRFVANSSQCYWGMGEAG